MESTANPPIRSPRAREIVAAARELLEREGPAGLSMRRVAERLGIRAPSLYKHVRDKGELEAALISEGFAEAAERFEAARLARRARRRLPRASRSSTPTSTA